MRLFFTSLAGLSILFSSFLAPLSALNEEEKKMQMVDSLETIKRTLDVHYAPSEWKKAHVGWDNEAEFHRLREKILLADKISTKQFQQIVKEFLSATCDYHVGVYFHSTESAFLPFHVKGAEGRYFISKIDRKQLPSELYHIAVGDELVLFNGRPVSDVIEEIKRMGGKGNVPETDQALAEINLTWRSGMRGDVVPRGPISISIKSASSGKVQTYQLIWNYTPEQIKNITDLPWYAGVLSFLLPSSKEAKNPERALMLSPLYELYSYKIDEESEGLGARKSFIPPLGFQEWVQNEPDKCYAYIYRNEEGRRIGYLRIPNYVDLGYADSFLETAAFFQENTDALVIDQVDNPGGYVFYLYLLSSLFTDQPLATPKHHIKITHEDVMESVATLQMLDTIPESQSPFASLQEKAFIKEFYQFIINEWNEGRTFTRPIYIEGLDHINPHPSIRYTKPILILINELDFSGGDFFPAIMQDNKRATLFGTRTAGAGGFVRTFGFPNLYGIAKVRYTGSLAERMNQEPLENLGVHPDIEYKMTAEDRQNSYIGYISAVNAALSNLLSPAETQ